MMKRLRSGYFVQTDTNSCGPIATFNAEKWLGRDVTVNDNDKIKVWKTLGPRRKLCKTSHNNFPMRGTKPPSMSQALNKLRIKYQETTDLELMKQSLNNGHSMILLYSFGKYIPGCRIDAHYVFVYKDRSNIYLINDDKQHFKTWKTFSSYCLENNPTDHQENKFPRAWIID